MPIHDYKCSECNFVVMDTIDPNNICPTCNIKMGMTMEFWKTFNQPVDGKNAVYKMNGEKNRYGALDDPLCKLKLGLTEDNYSGYNKIIPNEVKADLLNRITSEGDGPAIREQVLAIK